MGDKGNGGNGRVHRTILVEGVHNTVHGESASRSIHRYFRENTRMSKEKPLSGAADGTMENAHSNGGRDRSVHPVPHGAEMQTVVRKAHDGCRSCFHGRMTRCTLRFHNAAEIDHCNDLGGDDLRNAVHWESSGEASCEKLETSSGAQIRRRIQPQRVGVVYREWDNPKIRWRRP